MLNPTHSIARRTTQLTLATSMIVALGIGFSGCAREATPRAVSDTVASTEELSGTAIAPDSRVADTRNDPKSTQPVNATDSTVLPVVDETAIPGTPTTEVIPNPGPVTQTTLPKPGEFQVLVTVLETGGMCAGPCGEVQTILFSDGTWTQGLAPNPDLTVTATTLPPKHGQLDPGLTQTITEALGKSTATELKALPVTQQYCPSAADGRDLSFAYHIDGVEVTVSNCTIDLRQANPLVRLTSEALDAISAMANPQS
jgi:hypothetical protein